MDRIPDCLFDRILQIYSGISCFPGNLACVSKRCRRMCDRFKAKIIGEGAFVRMNVHAKLHGEIMFESVLIKIDNLKVKEVDIPPHILNFMGLGLWALTGEYTLNVGWELIKVEVIIVHKMGIWKNRIVWEIDPYGDGSNKSHLEKSPSEVRELLDGYEEDADVSIKHCCIAINAKGYRNGYPGWFDDALVLQFEERETETCGSWGGHKIELRTFLAKWDKVSIIDRDDQ